MHHLTSGVDYLEQIRSG